jgi:hypothetical protein
MGSVGGLLGTAGGAGGTGFAGPQQANITNPVTQGQITNAYTGVQGAQAQQNSLLSALQAQNGLANQSNVYNQLQNIAAGQGPNPAAAQLAQATSANTANQAALMAGQRGASQNVGLMARQAAQQGAANQQQAAGQAATMQAQQSLNALGQAGAMASGQVANQIGQTNANTQAQQAEQQNLLNAQGQYNSAAVGSQSSVNAANAGLANTQLQGQQAMLGGLANSMGGASGMIGSISSIFAKGGKVQRFDEGGDVNSAPQTAQDDAASGQDFGDFKGASTSAPMSVASPSFGSDAGASALASGMSGGGGKSGGGGGGAGGIMGLLALMAQGGSPDQAPTTLPDETGYAGKSKFGAFVKSKTSSGGASAATPSFGNNYGAQALYKGLSGSGKQQQQPDNYPGERGSSDMTAQYLGADAELGSGGDKETNAIIPTRDPNTGAWVGNADQDVSNDSSLPQGAEGGKVPALVSPGEQYLPPKDVKKVLKEGKNPLTIGERIPGKPKHPGNDYRNDTVKKTLESGGLVIPNKVMQSNRPHWEAMKFVHAHMAKNKKRLPSK